MMDWSSLREVVAEEGWLVSWIGAGVEDNGRAVFRPVMRRVAAR